MEAQRSQKTRTELCCRGLVGNDPARTPGNEGQASSVFAPAGGEPAETKKARSVVALSRVPRSKRGAPVRLRLPLTLPRSQEPFNAISSQTCSPLNPSTYYTSP